MKNVVYRVFICSGSFTCSGSETGSWMVIAERGWAEWAGDRSAKVLLSAMVYMILCGSTGRLLAQADARQTNGQQGTEVASAKAEERALPEAPQPVAMVVSAGAEVDRSAALTSGSSRHLLSEPPPSDGPTLGDLGLTPADIEGNAARQALFDRRTHMLKVHQKLGLITVLPVAAACLSSVGAPADKGNYSNTATRDLHVALGSVAVGMYAATASYAIRAPKVTGEPARGGVKWHKYLIYIHAPGMIMTPILGAMAYNQINSGQKVHGIASAHSGVAVATAASYGAAILAVSWPIHLKP
jgi:hypothetical protein